MPNRDVHIFVGFVFGILIFYLFQFQLNFQNLIVFLVISIIGSVLPDVIEKPISVNHRSLFHGLIIFVILIIIILLTFDEWYYMYLVAFCVGYGSHLLLDSTTRMGIPVIK